MKHPGSNLLKRAAKLIRLQPVQYMRFAGRTQNVARQFVDAFEPAKPLMMSVQPIPKDKYTEFGLDFKKNYVKGFASDPLLDLQRDSTGDKFIYGASIYQIENNGTWFFRDGWASCIAVEVGKVPPPVPDP